MADLLMLAFLLLVCVACFDAGAHAALIRGRAEGVLWLRANNFNDAVEWLEAGERKGPLMYRLILNNHRSPAFEHEFAPRTEAEPAPEPSQPMSAIQRLHRMAEIGAELDGKTNTEIADLLTHKVWAGMEIGTEELEIVEQAIDRLTPAKPPITAEELAAIEQRYEAASKMVSALCKPRGSEGSREWIMTIPARPDHDPDIVIGSSLGDIPKLLALLSDPELKGRRL